MHTGTDLVRGRVDLCGVDEDLQLCDTEVANANTLYEPVRLELLHLRPRGWDVRLGKTRVMNEVQIHIVDSQLQKASR